MAAIFHILHQCIHIKEDTLNSPASSQKKGIAKRVFLAALPIIEKISNSLKIPLSIFGSKKCLALPYLPVHTFYQTGSAIYEAYQSIGSKESVKKILTAFFETLKSYSRIFPIRFPFSIFINSIYIVESFLGCIFAFSQKNFSEIFSALFALSSSITVLALSFTISLELFATLWLLDILSYTLQCKKEVQQKNYIEAFFKFIEMGLAFGQSYSTFKSFFEKYRESLARFFHRLDAILAYPFYIWTRRAFRVFTPITSENPEQFKNYYLEVFARAVYWIIALPITPILLSISILEIIPRILANILQPNSFFFMQSEAEDADLAQLNIPAENEQVSVASGNLCFVDGGFSGFFGGVPSWEGRVDQVAAHLKSINRDVVTLQEVNSVRAAYALVDRLKTTYRYFYFNIGSKIFSQNSGLFVASKYKLSEPYFESFNSDTGLQLGVNKGLFSCRIASKNLSILTSHHSPSKDDGQPTQVDTAKRHNEFEKVDRRVQTIFATHQDDSIVYTTDANLVQNSLEFQNSYLATQFNPKSLAKEATCATDILIAQYAGKKITASMHPFICDYILLHDPKKQNSDLISEATVHKVFDLASKKAFLALSDHHLLTATIYPSKKS